MQVHYRLGKGREHWIFRDQYAQVNVTMQCSCGESLFCIFVFLLWNIVCADPNHFIQWNQFDILNLLPYDIQLYENQIELCPFLCKFEIFKVSIMVGNNSMGRII